MAQGKKQKSSPRWRSKMRSRRALQGSDSKPRICVFRSSKHTYAQVISDETGKTIVSASTTEKEVLDALTKLDGSTEKNSTKSVAAAKVVGSLVAQRALSQNIKKVLFDRNGFLYHGRVAAVATGAREGGLEF